MKLSAPIHQLKHQARVLKKQGSMTMLQALDAIAQREGFGSWSLLQARSGQLLPRRYDAILDYCNPADMVLVAGRPMHGKTSFAIGLMVQAMRQKAAPSAYFSLSFLEREVLEKMRACDPDIDAYLDRCVLDCSDAIDAEYIIKQTQGLGQGAVIVVDYLQLLDQKRTSPALQHQVERLKAHAAQERAIIFCISQVNRDVEHRPNPRPGLDDIHLPNPLDLGLFNKRFFLYRKSNAQSVEVTLANPTPHRFTVGWRQGRFC